MKYLLVFFTIFIGSIFYSCQESGEDNQFLQIYFKYGFRNELNTFNKTYQKDLVMDGTITTEFHFTESEQNIILKKASEINFFLFPDVFQPYPPQELYPDPGSQTLRIKYLNNDKTVVWEYPLNSNDPQAADLKEINDLIISIIESKPEYLSLPPARGGYL